MKVLYHSGKNPALYYWRESNGLEIDCILETEKQKTYILEIKGGKTFIKEYVKNLKKFPAEGKNIEKVLIWPGESHDCIGDIRITGENELGTFLQDIVL